MHPERGGSVGDRDCLTSVLETVAEKRDHARWNERCDRFEHVLRTAMLLRRCDDRAKRDPNIIDTTKN